MSIVTWKTGETHFKHDAPSRVDDAIEREREESAAERRINAEIDRRDRRECRCCGRKSDPEATGLTKRGHRHHIVYASACGSDEPFNRVTLCYECHNDEHKNRLRFTEDGLGYERLNANEGLEFWRKEQETGRWFLWKREIAPHITERD